MCISIAHTTVDNTPLPIFSRSLCVGIFFPHKQGPFHFKTFAILPEPDSKKKTELVPFYSHF